MLPHRTTCLPRRSFCLGLGLLISSTLTITGGCGRDALPDICPDVDVGELVISELRGEQSGMDSSDSFGDYIEVYNASGRTLNLQGLHVRLRAAGGKELEVFVRESFEVSPGAYAVVGTGLPMGRPDSVLDPVAWYAVGWDIGGGNPQENAYPKNLMPYNAGFVELEACGVLIDETEFKLLSLPTAGTIACGNAQNPPSADDNDDVPGGCWCVDANGVGGQQLLGAGLPGSPGEPNRCD